MRFHLANVWACVPDAELDDKKPLIVSGVKIILQDPNLRVAMTLLIALP